MPLLNEIFEADLKQLGEPSGRQDANYWNSWFDLVGRQTQKPFEWYASVGDVVNVISHYLKIVERKKNRCRIKMIHPGSGTSLLPYALCNEYQNSEQVVVDISEVALLGVQKLQPKIEIEVEFESRIKFIVHDIMKNSIPIDDGTFDFWVDKGFIDALFSKENDHDNVVQSLKLFGEANRLLRKNNSFMMVVTLAEKHSLDLIVNAWSNGIIDDASGNCWWLPVIDLWQLTPISGKDVPFCIVLTTPSNDNQKYDASISPILVVHKVGCNNVKKISLPIIDIAEAVHDQIMQIRSEYDSSLAASQSSEVLAYLEIKPYDHETNLQLLGEALRTAVWTTDDGKSVKPKWREISNNGSDEFHKVVPVAFGISKLVLQCIVLMEDLDLLLELMVEWSSDDFVDAIQSVDVDWDNSYRVGSVCDILKAKKVQT